MLIKNSSNIFHDILIIYFIYNRLSTKLFIFLVLYEREKRENFFIGKKTFQHLSSESELLLTGIRFILADINTTSVIESFKKGKIRKILPSPVQKRKIFSSRIEISVDF